MITLYGISNCDTIKKARKWLEAAGIDYHFHDYRKDGLSDTLLSAWCDELGWENLLNRRGTTWRQLPETDRDGIDHARAIQLMLAQPALIKRPLLDLGSARKLGFNPADYQTYFV
ncbi:MAG TPA: ArsC family reductase [Motiliproteus sp.]